MLCDIDPGGEQVAAAIAEAVFVEHDVADEPAWERAIQTVLDAHGRLDVLVNNAGIGRGSAVTDMTLEEWRALMAVNLDGVFLAPSTACGRCAYTAMAARSSTCPPRRVSKGQPF